jgi:hypothetical protein
MVESGDVLLLDGTRGMYIPQDFVPQAAAWTGIDPEDLEILEDGPEGEWYWESWENVMRDAVREKDGRTWHLEEDEQGLFEVEDRE